MSVLLHKSFEDLDGVPQDVRELSQLISRPLPASLARVEPSTLSSIAQEQLKEVFMQNCGADCDRQDRELLQDVLNLVLMTSAAMADSARIALSGGERRRTDMFMFPLFRTLARMCHDECSVSGSIPFIWPKGFDADHGVATMLISLVADDSTLHLQEIQDSRPHFSFPDATQSSARGGTVERDANDESNISPSAGDSDVNDDCDDGDDGDDDETLDKTAEEQSIGDEVLSQPASTDPEDSEGSSNEDDTSEESFQWYADTGRQLYNPEYLQAIRDRHAGITRQEEVLLDLPLYTQILTGQRVWPNVHFPIICVADSNNIVALIASVACQRRVWGIELPVVGLEVSPIGSGVRVHICWLDPTSDDGRLPIVHTIKPAGNVSGLTAQAAAAQGVFDLANPHSALLFSQFFLALRPQFSGLWDSISAQRLCRLEWRSDYNNATWTADIKEWAKDIDKSDDSSTTDSSDEIHPLTPESSFTEDQMAPKQKKTTLKGGILPGDGKPKTRSKSVLSVVPSNPPSAKVDSKASSVVSNTESRTKAWSCSAFAKLKASRSLENPDPSVLTWMVHRSTLLDTNYIFEKEDPSRPPLYKGQDKFEEMCNLYDDFTSFKWVKEWTELGKMPPVGPALEGLRDELYNQYRQVSEEPWAKVYADEKHAKIMKSKLSLLLACADGAFTRSTGSVNKLEAEGRHDWDAILSHFYVGGMDEVTSYNLLLERELRMPRNSLLDVLNGSDAELRGKLHIPFLSWAKRNRDVYAHLANQYYSEEGFSLEGDGSAADHEAAFLSQCNQTTSAADELLLEFTRLLKTPAIFRNIVEAQAKLEPSSGICDAVLFSSLPLGASADIRAAYKSFRLVIANLSKSEPYTRDSDGPIRQTKANPTRPDADIKPLDTLGIKRDTVQMKGLKFQTTPGSRKLISETDILLPQLIAEYKKQADLETKALNQDRMYLVAAVKFYAAVGIKEYPVFGLAVHGRIGNVIMAWMDDDGTIHILERNIRKFDLANPIQAFAFALFLLRLKDRDVDLAKRFEMCRETLAADLANGTYKSWAMPEKEKPSKAGKTDAAPNAGTLPSVAEEADEALIGELENLHLDSAKHPATPPADESSIKN